MISAHFLELAALALALTGLAAVVWEIASKDARLFRDIATDVRGMAEPRPKVQAERFITGPVSLGAHANNNEARKAA